MGPADWIERKTCDNCGRIEMVSQPAPDAFVKWKLLEGTLCPRCARGGTLLPFPTVQVRRPQAG